MQSLTPLILESLQLLVLGMGTVFIILILLIALITLVSKFSSNYEDDPLQQVKRGPTSVRAQTAPNSQGELVAVISAAIKAYRQHH